MCEEKYSGSERFSKNSEVAGYTATETLEGDLRKWLYWLVSGRTMPTIPAKNVSHSRWSELGTILPPTHAHTYLVFITYWVAKYLAEFTYLYFVLSFLWAAYFIIQDHIDLLFVVCVHCHLIKSRNVFLSVIYLWGF